MQFLVIALIAMHIVHSMASHEREDKILKELNEIKIQIQVKDK